MAMTVVMRNGVALKWCPACRMHRPTRAFNSVQSRADGLEVYCRACKREKQRAAYARERAEAATRVVRAWESPDPPVWDMDAMIARIEAAIRADEERLGIPARARYRWPA